MTEYESITSFNIEKWGKVVLVYCDKDRDRTELANLVGTDVLIDGLEHTIKGVESYALPTIRKGTPIGLLIDEGPRQIHIPEESLS